MSLPIVIILGIVGFILLCLIIVLIGSYCKQSTQYLLGFLASLAILSVLIVFFVTDSETFINGYSSWKGLILFGAMVVILPYFYFRARKKEIKEDSEDKFDDKNEQEINELMSKGMWLEAQNKAANFSSSYTKKKFAIKIAKHFLTQNDFENAERSIMIIHESDRAECMFKLFFEFRNDLEKMPKMNELKDILDLVLRTAVELAIQTKILHDFELEDFANSLIQISELDSANLLVQKLENSEAKQSLMKLIDEKRGT